MTNDFFSVTMTQSSVGSSRDNDSPATTSLSKLDSNSEEEANNSSSGSSGNGSGIVANVAEGSNTPVEECTSQIGQESILFPFRPKSFWTNLFPVIMDKIASLKMQTNIYLTMTDKKLFGI
jgi:hypothetical protein